RRKAKYAIAAGTSSWSWIRVVIRSENACFGARMRESRHSVPKLAAACHSGAATIIHTKDATSIWHVRHTEATIGTRNRSRRWIRVVVHPEDSGLRTYMTYAADSVICAAVTVYVCHMIVL